MIFKYTCILEHSCFKDYELRTALSTQNVKVIYHLNVTTNK